MTTERVSLFEIDQPFCSKTYGTTNAAGPCTAVLGVTGSEKCHNTRATCQDVPNYLPGTKYSAVTISIASPAVITWTAHGMTSKDLDRGITFGTSGALPTGLSPNVLYYVKTILTTDTFTVSATPGGTAINTSGTQSGAHRAILDLPLTLRFTFQHQEGLLAYGPFIPHIQHLEIRPAVVNLGGMDQNASALGIREQVTVSMKTSKYNDLLVDKYRLERISTVGEIDYNFLGGSPSPTHGDASPLTVTRAGATATRVKPNGQIEVVAANTVRFDHDPKTGAARGVLIEPARTNYVLWNRDLTNAVWTPSAATVSANTDTAPDGTATGDRLVESATTAEHKITTTTTIPRGTRSEYSVFVRRGSGTRNLVLRIQNPAGTSVATLQYNLTNITVSASASGGALVTYWGIEDWGGGLFRCWVVCRAEDGVATADSTIVALLADASMAVSYAGDGSSSLMLWGFQAAPGERLSSVILTEGSTVTRNADSSVDTNLSWLNLLEGTIVCEFDVNQLGEFVQPFALEDSANPTTEFITYDIETDGWTNYFVVDGGVHQSDITFASGSVVAKTPHRVVLRYKANDLAASAEGAAIQTDAAATIPTLNRLVFGQQAGAGWLGGHIRRFTYYPRTMANAAMVSMSGSDNAPETTVAFGYDPYDRGDFWGKWLARNPYHQHYDCRVIEGVVGQSIDEMDVRHYLISRIDGPDDKGSVNVVCKDIFSLIESRKALCPRASKGELAAAITTTANTSFTLFPTGIGAEYDASGHLAIGDEVIGYTRSGDTVTTTSRGAFNTVAATHNAEDLVQQVYSEVSQKAHDIAYRLLTNFSQASLTMIDKASWDAVAASMVELYTARIATPTPVNELLSEITQQAGFTLHPNVRTRKIEFTPLRAASSVATINDLKDMLASSPLRVSRDDQKRASQVWVYYAPRSPVESLDDKRNYLSRIVVVDTAAEHRYQYGTPAVREVFSRWIPAGGRNFAENAGERILFMFRDPPTEAEFSIRPDNPIAPLLVPGKFVDLEIGQVQNSVGKKTKLTQGIIRVRRTPSTIDVYTQAIKFSAAVEGGPKTVYVETDTPNINFRSAWELLYGPATSTSVAKIIILVNSTVYSSSVGSYAFDTGEWPSGATITLELYGKIQGKGGEGGRAGGYTTLNGANGQNGGPALKVRYPITIIGNGSGKVWSGAGGGGGGSGSVDGSFENWHSGGSGGGGAGYNVGTPGATNPSPSPDPANWRQGGSGSNGTVTAGGAGGLHARYYPNNTQVTGDGGAGGSPGAAGSAGQTFAYATYGVRGLGGNPGNAIEGTSFITYSGTAPQILGPTTS